VRSEKLPAARPIPFRIHIDRFVIRDRREIDRDSSGSRNSKRVFSNLPTASGAAWKGRLNLCSLTMLATN
jgi:hypothetical protein